MDWTVGYDWLQPASCKFLHGTVHAQYANEGCNTCASVAGLVASFIIVARGFYCNL